MAKIQNDSKAEANAPNPEQDVIEDSAGKKSWTEEMRGHAQTGIRENRSILRGLTMACLEQVRLSSALVTNFVEGVANGEKDNNEDSSMGRIKHTKHNVADGLRTAISESMKVPGKTIDKFYSVYKEQGQSQA